MYLQVPAAIQKNYQPSLLLLGWIGCRSIDGHCGARGGLDGSCQGRRLGLPWHRGGHREYGIGSAAFLLRHLHPVQNNLPDQVGMR